MLNFKYEICDLFDIFEDEGGVQRVVTPLEYFGTGDRVVVRVRPNSSDFQIDENGEAALYASLNGGGIETEAVRRWAQQLSTPIKIGTDHKIYATTSDPRLLALLIFRVAEAAQQLHTAASCGHQQA